jgi:capsular exopolysaccharide synthesis family protein
MGARDYLTLLREQKWFLAAFVVLGLVGAIAVTALTPRSYASFVTFYVVSNGVSDSTSTEMYQGAQLSTDRVKSYAELLASPQIAEDAARLLGGSVPAEEIQDGITTDSVTDTVIVTMSVTAGSPERARAIAGAVTETFTRLVADLETPRTPQLQGVPIVVLQLVRPPSDPVQVGPRTTINLAIGLALGLLLGFGLAIARASFVRVVRSPEELAEVARCPVLTVVPRDRSAEASPVAVVDAPGTPTAEQRSEAYQRLRAHLEFADSSTRRRVLVVSSALHDEGKTTTAINLAAALAGTGHRVVVVETDLRRPAVLRSLGLAAGPGLVEAVAGVAPFETSVQSWHGAFDVLGAGEVPPRPNELLASDGFVELVEKLRQAYDYVLLDAPPILPVSDATVLGRRSDGLLLVCRMSHTSREAVIASVVSLREDCVPLVGAVLSHGVHLPTLKKEPRRPVGHAPAVPPEQVDPEQVDPEQVDPVTAPAPRAPVPAWLSDRVPGRSRRTSAAGP